jgi:transposase-like protein
LCPWPPSHAKQFELLPSYVDAIKAADPNAPIHLSLDDRNGTRRFERIFIALSAAARSFAYCRWLVAVDATYMREAIKLASMLAVALEADNHGVVLAWAMTEGESESSWRWFFSHLRHACPDLNSEHRTLMSDRDKGLKKADAEIPLAQHVFCTEHLSSNINTLFSRGSREAFSSRVRQATTEASFREGMQKLAAVSARAANYVDGTVDKSTWAAPFLRGLRYGHNTSNIVESINGHLVPERKMAIVDCLHSIWNRVMDFRYKRWNDANEEKRYLGSRVTLYGKAPEGNGAAF